MRLIETDLRDVWLVEIQPYDDNRGWFVEVYNSDAFKDNGINFIPVQLNHSYSKEKHTIRGMHFQLEPMAQAKLVRCIRGQIMDVAVDIRKQSPHFGEWTMVELSSQNFKQLYIPKGFAHGFITMTSDVEVQYMVNEYYAPKYELSFSWKDSFVSIDWPVETPTLSDKDREAPDLKSCGI